MTKALVLCPFKRGAWGRRCLFQNSIISNIMVYQDRFETNLLKLENSEWFYIISAFIFEVNIVAQQKQAYW